MQLLGPVAVVLLAAAAELATPTWRRRESVGDVYGAANVTLVPDTILELSFDTLEISPGQQVSLTDIAVLPNIAFDFEIGRYYTFIAMDIDLPSRHHPHLSAALLTLYVNVYGTDSGVMIEDACDAVEWVGPSPPVGSGPHRYTFYVYKQKEFIDKSDMNLQRLNIDRLGFNIDEFAPKYGLSGPIAGSFVLAEYPMQCYIYISTE